MSTIEHPRLIQLQRTLAQQGFDALYIAKPIDLYYLLGVTVSLGRLLISSTTATLFVDGRYFEACRKQVGCEVILSTENTFAEYLQKTLSKNVRVAFDSGATSYADFLQLEKWLAPLETLPLATANPLKGLRSVKDVGEIALLEEAASLGSRGFDHVCSLLREGISEQELAIELEIFWRRQGGEKVAFDPIIAFGPNSAMPHYHAGNTRLERHQPVLIDIGVVKNQYHSDMTRVVFFDTPSDQMRQVYETVRQAQEAALRQCRPGISVAALDQVARDVIVSAGYGEYFVHSLGHGVGLEIHEFPTLKNVPENISILLQPGMVITIEPGIYLPGVGGVRIEDTIVITDDGHMNMTKRPKELNTFF